MTGVLCILAASSGLRTVAAPSVAWSNISDAVGGGATAGNAPTVSFLPATSRVLTFFDTSVSGHTVQVKVGAGAFTTIASGGTFTVNNGQAVQFQLFAASASVSTVTVQDGPTVIGTFTLTDV